MDTCRNRKLKPRPPWSNPVVKPANPMVELIGETLERIHAVPIDAPGTYADYAGYKSVVLCFSNGKIIHLNAEIHMSKEGGILPVIRSWDGHWEMIEAEPDKVVNVSREPIREPGTPDLKQIGGADTFIEMGGADLHEIDGANQD